MGKKKSRTSQTSKGERNNVRKDVRKIARREYLQSWDRLLNQMEAYRKHKRVMLTVPNPNPNETNKRFIRIPAENYVQRPGERYIIK